LFPFCRFLLLKLVETVVILGGMFVRTVKVPSSSGAVNEYVRIVESYREGGKVKQRTIADLGRKDVLTSVLPQLERVLRGDASSTTEAAPVAEDIEILDASTWGPVLVMRTLFEQLGLWAIFDELLGQRDGEPIADRAFVLIANRLIHPTSEHGLARWLDTDFVCDRRGRRFVPRWRRHGRVQVDFKQLEEWYRTLDALIAAKGDIEVQLYGRLRDLFSLRPELVFYDITSTYFEGSGPEELARHGYSRDGKPQNVQVVVGVVMVAGWPIAHHVWAGNRLDVTTVQEVIRDLTERFQFGRVIFVGDRGMVSDTNIEALKRDGHGYLVGLKRRRNAEVDRWLQQIDDRKWQDCPMGINVREKFKDPPRTRVQEVTDPSAEERVFVIDSDERRAYEQAKRLQAMERTRQRLAKVQARVAAGKLTQPTEIGAAAERALRAHHGYRYYDWKFRDGVFEFFEHPVHLEREKRLEGKYVIASGEKRFDAVDAVAIYKELTTLEGGFRCLKDVLHLRPIYHQVDHRVRAHIFVAALGLLNRQLLERRLKETGVNLSPEQALQAVACIRHVTFQLPQGRRHGVSAANAQAQEVIRALGITSLRPPPPPEGQETRM
jgi:transposase